MSRLPLGPVLVLALAGCVDSGKQDTSVDSGPIDSGGTDEVDADGDGFVPSNGDCDDTDPKINPEAVEVCDGLDNNCDSQVDEGVATFYYVDADLDGFGDDATAKGYCEPAVGLTTVAGDCDDTDPDFHPNAEEPCTTDIDYNCDGVTAYADDDADGWALCEDCDDLDPAVNPDATEICNGLDDDCDGETDPTSSFDVVPFYRDADADGYGDVTTTTDACAAPPGYTDDTTDCDDTRADVNPGAPEVCDADNVDENCDGPADDDDPTVDPATFTAWYRDADGDSYGLDSSLVEQCDAPAGFLAAGGDCNDYSASFYPGAPELDCSDPNDYNCDGSVAYTDADSDGWAACIECNDGDAAVNPAATELCNGVDDNCDGLTDPDSAADALTWYADADGDTFGDPAVHTASCAAPSGYVADATDCDDTNLSVNPRGSELCNGIDDDCDTVVDPSTSLDALTWYADTDGDTFGDAANTTPACSQPAGYVADASDCADTDAAIFPGATELCNGLDDDCDAVIDPPSAFDAITWYADTDGDTYGNAAVTAVDCSTPAGYCADNTDCNDTRADVNPGAAEECDSLNTDEDCDGLADDADPSTDPASMTTTHVDVDGDGYGNPAISSTGCEAPSGYIVDGTDCNDARSGVHPGASEYCDALDVDEDCDGLADDDDPSVSASTYDTWYEDNDGDSFGSSVTLGACDLPSGYAGTDGDCNDADAAINPDAEEICDSIDNDCDGNIDLDSSGSDVCWDGTREFTTCTATGYSGPTQTNCNTEYSGTTLDGEVTVSSGIQSWTVPTTGTYVIDAYGAKGFAGEPTVHGGYGAHALGTFSLTAGDVLYIVVGQKGTGGWNSGGGGGGSFVVKAPSTPLVVAGGGGGTRNSVTTNGCDGRSGTYGGAGSGYSASSTCPAKAGSLGLGGVISSVSWGSGGGGFNGDGNGERTYVSSSWGGDGGKSWTNGLVGGMGNALCGRADGGFGAGGSGNGCWGGGGGGGYSGGDGGRVAGGGGSYVDSSSSSTSTTAGVNNGDGYVTIEML